MRPSDLSISQYLAIVCLSVPNFCASCFVVISLCALIVSRIFCCMFFARGFAIKRLPLLVTNVRKFYKVLFKGCCFTKALSMLFSLYPHGMW